MTIVTSSTFQVSIVQPVQLPFFSSMAAGEWKEVFLGGTGPTDISGGILAYSGFALDSAGERLIFFGGGHNDYPGNDVWQFDLPTRIMVQKYARDYGTNPPLATIQADVDNVTFPGRFMASNRPIGRHTYASDVWIPSIGKMHVGGGSTYSGTGEYLWAVADDMPVAYWNSPRDTWLYDPAANTWEWKGAWMVGKTVSTANSAPFPAQRYITLAVDTPEHGSVMHGLWQHPVSKFWYAMRWEYLTNTWVELAANPSFSSIGIGIAYSPSRGQIYSFGGEAPVSDKIWAYTIATNAWSEIVPVGTRPTARADYGITYDVLADELIVVGRTTAIGLWRFSFATMQWTQHLSGFPVGMDLPAFGLVKYCPRQNVTFLTFRKNAGPVNIWAYRAAT